MTATSTPHTDPTIDPTAHPAPAAAAGTGLTVSQGTALSVGAVLGTGVISLPAVAAGIAGPASLVAWLIMVVLSVPLASTFAALGARHPDSGGVSTYVRRAFGGRAATVVGWVFYFAVPAGAPAAAMMAGNYVADAIGGGRTTTILVGFGLIILVVIMNAFGLKISGRVQLGLTGGLALIMTLTIIAALPHARLSHLTPFAPHGWSAIGPAAAVLVWGFAGWEAVSSLSAEYRHPGRDVPRATTAAIAIVAVLYLGLATTALLVLGAAAGDSKAPLSDVLAIGVGGQVRAVTALVAVLLTIGTMNAYFAGGSKLGSALGRDGGLPAWIGHGSAVGAVPRRSLLITGALAMTSQLVATVFDLDVSDLVLLTTGAFTLVYIFGTAAAVRLLPRRTPGWWTAVIALFSVLVLAGLTGLHIIWALAVALGGYLYARLRPVRSRRS